MWPANWSRTGTCRRPGNLSTPLIMSHCSFAHCISSFFVCSSPNFLYSTRTRTATQVLVRGDGHHDDGDRAAPVAQRRAQVGPVRGRRRRPRRRPRAFTRALPRRLLFASLLFSTLNSAVSYCRNSNHSSALNVLLSSNLSTACDVRRLCAQAACTSSGTRSGRRRVRPTAWRSAK